MLSVRLSDPFRAVYSLDEALLEHLTDKEIREYRTHRRYEDIEPTLLEKGGRPTVFTCDPLKVEHEHFVDQIATTSGVESVAAWSIFRHHVRKIENYEGYLKRDKDDAIDDAYRKIFPRDAVTEIALLITEKANGDTRGFTVPHTFAAQLIRARSALRLATVAPKESVNEKTTGTDSE